MNENVITSLQNGKVKRLVLLQQKSAERRKAGVFVVEGQREIEHCLEAGYELDSMFWCPSLMADGGEAFMARHAVPNATYEVTEEVYGKIAYRGSTEGIVALVRERKLTLEELALGEHPLIIVLESVEKPGNLGAVLRSADAAQADAVIVCDPLTDL